MSSTEHFNSVGTFRPSPSRNSVKSKLKLWQSNVTKYNFLDFGSLNNFIKISNWKNKNLNIQTKVNLFVHELLNELQQNFGSYFPDNDYLNLNSLLWIVQPFTNEEFDLGHLTNELIELRSDLLQKAEFKSFKNYNEFWILLLKVYEYRILAQKAISILICMPTTYLCEQRFSALLKIKLKKRNSIKDDDTLMRRLKRRFLPCFSQLTDKIQQQSWH